MPSTGVKMTREKFFREVSALALELPRAVYYNFAAAAQDFVCHLESQIPRWRSVERDGLPKEGDCLLRMNDSDGNLCVGYWRPRHQTWMVGDFDVCPGRDVTHYLPVSELLALLDLPKPREEQP